VTPWPPVVKDFCLHGRTKFCIAQAKTRIFNASKPLLFQFSAETNL
jgi:hypothetical protein